MQASSLKRIMDACERFIYEKSKKKIEMPINKAIKTLHRLDLVSEFTPDDINIKLKLFHVQRHMRLHDVIGIWDRLLGQEFGTCVRSCIRSPMSISPSPTTSASSRSPSKGARGDKTCIIRREEMVTAKKLLCGHLFHVHCLRSWLQRQNTWPTCRALVVPPESGPGASHRQQGNASHHQPGYHRQQANFGGRH
ncbi:ERAD-associated E3 ubiquitin-protein ligase HRD1B-like [Iris pallida]|uniref:ERAD-associated E3 ubiquitin-protein ligase HRD1B-like n=1 Tax=Iris pallida TaxID=29817 RepID=A0AAX6DVS2_IRIPA|nr:ERAD-associated E3 ubiquitin-protein ligase HRD1B-like [Iris pallida]